MTEVGFTLKGAGDNEQGEGRDDVRACVCACVGACICACARVIVMLTTVLSENGAPCLQVENGQQNKLTLTLHGR